MTYRHNNYASANGYADDEIGEELEDDIPTYSGRGASAVAQVPKVAFTYQCLINPAEVRSGEVLRWQARVDKIAVSGTSDSEVIGRMMQTLDLKGYLRQGFCFDVSTDLQRTYAEILDDHLLFHFQPTELLELLIGYYEAAQEPRLGSWQQVCYATKHFFRKQMQRLKRSFNRALLIGKEDPKDVVADLMRDRRLSHRYIYDAICAKYDLEDQESYGIAELVARLGTFINN